MLELRTAITERGTYVHAALSPNEAKGRTLCGRRYVSTSPWDWEEFDDCWHCSKCWNKAKKLKEQETENEPQDD